ncbi:btb poz [Fusarium albosuccineum]|uniref:Btb poz n=1 Tax=Fusarium albosuccineum TaxID=1237068 RepID=A0A8H4LE43_9HYPO|nr:btb poz [Fusarium albosuccineum]
MATPAANPAMLAELMGAGKFSDLTLICQGKQFHLHKSLVCTQSPVIAAILEKAFKVHHDPGSLKAAAKLADTSTQTSILHITEFDLATVECMVEFLYSEDYAINGASLQHVATNAWTLPANVTSSTAGANGKVVVTAQPQNGSLPPQILRQILLCHVDVNAIGHHFKLPKLCQKALTYIETMLRDGGSLAVFSDVAIAAYKSSDDEKLHDLISSFASKHIDELLNTPGFDRASSVVGSGLLKTAAAKLRASQDRQSVQESTKERVKLIALQDELESLKQKLKSLTLEHETLSRDHEMETKKTAVILAQRNTHKQALDDEKEKTVALNHELALLKKQVASTTVERDEFVKCYEAEKKQATTERNKHKQALNDETERAKVISARCETLNKLLAAEKQKTAAAVSERDNLEKALGTEKQRAAGLTDQRDNFRRERNIQAKTIVNTLNKDNEIVAKIVEINECRNCGIPFGGRIENSSTRSGLFQPSFGRADVEFDRP